MAEIYKQEWKSPTSVATVYANAYRIIYFILIRRIIYASQ